MTLRTATLEEFDGNHAFYRIRKHKALQAACSCGWIGKRYSDHHGDQLHAVGLDEADHQQEIDRLKAEIKGE